MSDDQRGREEPPATGGELPGRTAASEPDAESQRDPAPGSGDAPPDRPRKSVKEQVERMEGEGGPPSPSRPGRPRGE
jgi:hypothetical protein